MSETFTYPSPAFPAQPEITMSVPKGWVALAAVGLPMAFAREGLNAKFRPNVLVTLKRFGAGAEHSLLRNEVNKGIKQLGRFKEKSRQDPFEFDLGTQVASGIRLEGTFNDGKRGLVFQTQRTFLIPTGYVSDLIQVTGSCEVAQITNVLEEILAIHDSLRLNEVRSAN